MLRAAEADALGAKRPCLDRIARNVGVRPHAQFAERLCPAHDLEEFRIVGLGIHRVELTLNNASGSAVERNPVSGFEHLPFDVHLASLLVHVDVAGACYAAFAHAARNDGRVAGHTSA